MTDILLSLSCPGPIGCRAKKINKNKDNFMEAALYL
jgi:hypothetical protein